MDSAAYASPAMSMPMTFPPLADDVRQQLQGKLPFPQESGRNPNPAADPPGAYASAMPSSYQTQQAFSNASDQEFKERLHRAARNIETRIKTEVDDCRAQLRRELMYAGGIAALVLAMLAWRVFRTA